MCTEYPWALCTVYPTLGFTGVKHIYLDHTGPPPLSSVDPDICQGLTGVDKSSDNEHEGTHIFVSIRSKHI